PPAAGEAAEGSGFRLSAECLDEPPNSRVFVVLGKDTGEAVIRERFAPFGDIQNIWLLRDKRTNESRGIAFIKFARSSQACRAMEEMHGRSLVPDTKPIKVPPPGRAGPFLPASRAGRGASDRGPAGDFKNFVSSMTNVQFNHIALYECSLFLGLTHIVLKLCTVFVGYAVIQYSTAASAIYAKYKLHGFEYPPGNRLTVIFLEDGSDSSDLIRKMATQLVTAHVSSVLRNNSAVQAFGGTSGSQLLQPQTDAILPPHKKKVPPDTSVKERLFILFHPHPLPVNVLEDVFCRFGHLIKVYLVAGKNVGYAKFADRASASDAITALHGKIVNGVRLKVRLADSPTEESNKRQRTY
uniref:RNA binding motif protein 45 n=1 Tax=Strix occidentalis caurina TaxID=311401 RepID=A0A8D0FH48_STROC